MKIISVRESPEYVDTAIRFLQCSWPEVPPEIYRDCMEHCIGAENPLPQWYLLEDGGAIIGCAGLVTNDFISRMDLYPWFCALYIAEERRGKDLGRLLVDKAMADAKRMGYANLYLCTDHVGYYEKMGFAYVGEGYHPWGESSRIYRIGL